MRRLYTRGRLTPLATSPVGERGDGVGSHLLAQFLVPHPDLVGAESRDLRHGRRVHAVAVLVRLLLDDALHLDVAVLAVEGHLLLELGTHLGL